MNWESAVGLLVNSLIALGTLWAAKEAAKAAKGSEAASRAVERQTDVAESSRKIQILPHVVIHSLQEGGNRFSTYLVVENVGPGAAIDVKIRILKGGEYSYVGMLLSDYSPIKNGISVMSSNARLGTILGSNLDVQTGENDMLTTEFEFEIEYMDIEEKTYGPFVYNLQKNPMTGRVSMATYQDIMESEMKEIVKSLNTIAKNN